MYIGQIKYFSVVLSIYQDLTRIIQRPGGCTAVFGVASTIILLFQKKENDVIKNVVAW